MLGGTRQIWLGGWGDPRAGAIYPSLSLQSPPKVRRQQMDLISELKRKQQKEPLIYESDRDGAIEDIITGEGLTRPILPSVCPVLSSNPSPTPPWESDCLTASLLLFLFFFFLSLSPPPSQPSVLKTVPFTARTGKRTSRLLCEASLGEEIPL